MSTAKRRLGFVRGMIFIACWASHGRPQGSRLSSKVVGVALPQLPIVLPAPATVGRRLFEGGGVCVISQLWSL